MQESMAHIRKAKIMTVVGARPNFMKAAPILAAIRQHNDALGKAPASSAAGRSELAIESVLVHTGQHSWRFEKIEHPESAIVCGMMTREQWG
jgi:UDP-N-acetylglucosamine 2-epimerase